MVLTPADPTKAQVWVRNSGTPDIEFDFYIPRGSKGDPGGIVLGPALGVTDLNTIVTAGTYYQNDATSGTLARNYPRDAVAGNLVVFQAASVNLLKQIFYPVNGSLQGKLFYVRQFNTSAWTAWAAYGSSRVDQTAGRAIYQWDDLNSREQLVYGDTGARAIGDILLNGWTANTSAEVSIRRQGSTVTLNAKMGSNVATSDLFFAVPNGWRPRTQDQHVISGAHSSGAFRYARARWDGNLYVDYTTTGTVYVGGAWSTTDNWPTTLPGVALGTIPNL